MNAVEQTPEHRPVESFDLDNKWVTPCSCGLRFTGSSPSTAYGSWKKHAAAQTPKPAPEVATPPPARVRECGCGCDEPLAPRAGGLFRSGHDARFKSILTTAHAAAQSVRHPATGVDSDPLDVADWLDERRGGGDFWRSKVLAGHRPQPDHKPRVVRLDKASAAERAILRVDAIMEALATRRPVPGDLGVVTLRSGHSYGAQVLKREGEEALAIRLLEGPRISEQLVVPDSRFEKAKK